MVELNLSKDDIRWLSTSQPLLNVSESKDLITGTILFKAYYDRASKELIILNEEPNVIPENYIDDAYKIEINFNHEYSTLLPSVKEIGNRIPKNIGLDKTKDFRDIHTYEDNIACLCPPIDEGDYKTNFDLAKFIDGLVIPFFYSESYFYLYEKWPWVNYSHGPFWVLERYFIIEKIDSENIELHLKYLIQDINLYRKVLDLLKQKPPISDFADCVCGSKKRFSSCHTKVLRGLNKLKRDLRTLNYPIKKL